jgi:hypothetical protein
MLDNNLQPIKDPLEIIAEMKEEKENKVNYFVLEKKFKNQIIVCFVGARGESRC